MKTNDNLNAHTKIVKKYLIIKGVCVNIKLLIWKTNYSNAMIILTKQIIVIL